MPLRDPAYVPDLSGIAAALPPSPALATTRYGDDPQPGAWRDVVWRAAFAFLNSTPGIANTIRDRIAAHVAAEMSCTPDDPRCEAHPFVATVLSVMELSYDGPAILRTILASPEWVAVHGVAIGPDGDVLTDAWRPHAPVQLPPPPRVKF